MKKSVFGSLLVATLTLGLTLNGSAGTRAGEVDFGNLGAPGKGGKYVEVNLGSSLISLAARLIEKPQPEAATLLRSVHLIRVNVVGLQKENRSETEKRIHDLRDKLTTQGWERIVTVQEPDGEDVAIFVKARNDESLEGVVVTVVDSHKEEAVFVNLVGDIKPEQIASVGEALNLDPLKKLGGKIKK